jgi:hypothetical protein
VRIFPLHSSLSSSEQNAVFQPMPPGVRKIVVATNIAETSVTIEDVVYVIDTCRVKENSYDEVFLSFYATSHLFFYFNLLKTMVPNPNAVFCAHINCRRAR